ncbi:gliding motility lipoprotein GldH [Flavobacteriaceae bacterium]|jgi:gliding motility-associated lipoprotein GldH|nr:gliding motility lipoprotein GldH [Flavobacteriaceae bacterium]
MIHKKLHSGISFLVLICFFCCVSEEEFSLQRAISKKGLTQRPMVFEIPSTALKGKPQNIFIWLRNTSKYEFSNIFLIASLKVNNETRIQDTLEFAMTNNNGSWLGKGFTEIKENKLWWKEGLIIPNEGPVQIEIAQAMRNNGKLDGVPELKGIISLGISIEDQQ